MAQIFISFSSEDEAIAKQVTKWLEDGGIRGFFRSADDNRGIKGGEAWEEVLYRELRGARVFLPLISANWLKSHWCHTELRFARFFGHHIIPVRLDASDTKDVAQELQDISLAIAAAEARDRLTTRLDELLRRRRGTLSSTHSLFPGIAPFSESYAPVFFGRDADIWKLRTTLNAKLNEPAGSTPRVVVLTGASGVGKSSLLRAGLIPDLATEPLETGFLVLGPIRPSQGLRVQPDGLVPALARLLEPTKGDALAQAKKLAKAADPALSLCRPLLKAKRHALLLVVDQAEELLSAEGDLLEALRRLLGTQTLKTIGLFAARADRAVEVQALFGGDLHTLRPLEPKGLHEVITGPLRLAGLHPAEDFVKAVLADATGGADALPLLAHLLAEMESGSGDRFTLRQYKDLGGLPEAIERAAEAAFDRHPPAAQEAARQVFVPMLVRLDGEGQPKLHRVARKAVPDAALPVLDAFIAARLLREEADHGIEPAHEALLHRWPRLESWLQAERENLVVLAAVERDAAGWHAAGKAPDRLLHRGERLVEAKKLRQKEGYAPRLAGAPGAYLDECADWEAKQAKERKAREQEVARGAALVLASEARRANEAGLHDRAMRLALAAWLQADAAQVTVPLVEAELARAAHASRQLLQLRADGGEP